MHPDDERKVIEALERYLELDWKARKRYLGWSIENPGVKRHLVFDLYGRAISVCGSSRVGGSVEHIPDPQGPLFCARCLRSFQRTQ